MKHFSHRLSRAALLAAGIGALFAAPAHAGIEIQRSPPAAAAPAPSGQKSATATTTATAPTVQAPGSAIKGSPAAAPSAPLAVTTVTIEPSFEIKKGKRIDHQLAEYGKSQGWELIWEAPEFVFDKSKVLPGDFEAALVFFLNGANETGEQLRATFYRGNKTVRVTEF